jgi:hypothetical protein
VALKELETEVKQAHVQEQEHQILVPVPETSAWRRNPKVLLATHHSNKDRNRQDAIE